MKIANRPLNFQAMEIEDTETKIRIIVKNEFLKRTPKSEIDRLVKKEIMNCLKKIKIKDLRQATYISLKQFYERQYRTLNSELNGKKLLITLAILTLANIKETKEQLTNLTVKQAVQILKKYDYDVTEKGSEIKLYGVPARKFGEEYIKKDVNPVFERLAKQYPYDPGDIRIDKKEYIKGVNKHINSLRNRAEMEVRYQAHKDNIENLKKNGHKLVIASSHADCSKRCRPWQGRVYSLDGTYGKTDDGRDYVPLEKATDIEYHTNAGKTYKNGLLGFNCRHYLVPYKNGFEFPKVSAQTEKNEYKITLKQRALERDVRYYRTEAIMYKDIDENAYKQAKIKAIKTNNYYIQYSKENGRAYYPSRTKLI